MVRNCARYSNDLLRWFKNTLHTHTPEICETFCEPEGKGHVFKVTLKSTTESHAPVSFAPVFSFLLQGHV